MPFDSSGRYSLPPGSLGVTGQTILAVTHNRPVQDIEAALSVPYLRDGRAPMTANIPMNGYQAKGAANATDPQDYVTLAQMQAAIASVSLPTGTMIHMTGTAVPIGWVVASGLELLRADYPAFWAWIQTSGNLAATQAAKTHGQYGPGNGTTTFTTPNMYGASTADGGYFIRAVSSGRLIGTVQQDDNKNHSHAGTALESGEHSHTVSGSAPSGGLSPAGNFYGIPQSVLMNTSLSGQHTHVLSITSSGGTEARPKNIAYPVLIKT